MNTADAKSEDRQQQQEGKDPLLTTEDQDGDDDEFEDVSYYHETNDEDDDDDDEMSWRDLWLSYPPATRRAVQAALIGAIGAVLGRASLLLSDDRRTTPSGSIRVRRGAKPRDNDTFLLDLVTYAVQGYLIQGPMRYYWTKWWSKQETQSYSTGGWSRSRSALGSSKAMLMEQILVQPALLLLTYISLDITKAALQELPRSWHRSTTSIAPMIVDSWRFWPLLVYLSGKLWRKDLKKRKWVLRIATLLWMSHIAKARARVRARELLEE